MSTKQIESPKVCHIPFPRMDEVDYFNKICARIDINDPPADLKVKAMMALEKAYSHLVERNTMMPGETDLEYAHTILGVQTDSPLDVVESSYKILMGRLLRFKHWLRNTRVGLLKPVHTEAPFPAAIVNSVADRFNRCAAQLHSMFLIVYHSARLNKMRDTSHSPPLSEMLVNVPRVEIESDDSAEYSDQHKLILYSLHRLSEMQARRFDEWVMVPKVTTTGYNSTAYERYCKIEAFIQKKIDKEVEKSMWMIKTSSRNVCEWTARVLQDHDNSDFPDLIRSRTTFAFNDGVYYADTMTFRPYNQDDRRINTIHPNPLTMSDEDRAALNQMQERLYSMMQWNFTAADDAASSSSRTPSIAEQLQRQSENLMLGDEAIGEASACVYFDMSFNQQEVSTHRAHCACL